jgi:hypothetical protein
MVPIKLSGVEIAGVELSASQVQQILYVLVGFVIFILLVLVVNFLPTPKKSRTDKKLAKAEPQYEEIFEVETELFESSPYKSDPDSVLENSVLQTVSLTLIVGLREHLTKLENSVEMAENPSDQHKAMLAVANYLEAKQVAPIAFTHRANGHAHDYSTGNSHAMKHMYGRDLHSEINVESYNRATCRRVAHAWR